MILRRRLDRLEARTPPPASSPPVAVLRLLMTPSASGPVVVAAMARRVGKPWRHIDREPGEALGIGAARAWPPGRPNSTCSTE
jgi:transcriptional regulator GlxA family with amidase domain